MIYPVDLQIKNWIHFDGKPVQVWSISEDRLHLDGGGRISEYRNDGHCQPITLTPEIFENCGFKKHTHGTYIYYRLRHVRIGRLNEGWVKVDSDCAVDSIEFFSLHQLQNLYFSLTGEELKYNP